MRRQATNDSFIASIAETPRSATSAGANQFSIVNTAATIITSRKTSKPVPVIARSGAFKTSVGSVKVESCASPKAPKMPAPETRTSTMTSPRLTAPMIMSCTKCGPWNPSNKCETRSGSPRSSARQPIMKPPMNTGVNSDCPTVPTNGTRLTSTVRMA